jgi:hypothetical protein
MASPLWNNVPSEVDSVNYSADEDCVKGTQYLIKYCLLLVTYFSCQLYICSVLSKQFHKTESKVSEVEGWRQLGNKYAARLNTEPAVRTEMNGMASRTCLQTYIIWNLDRSCTYPQGIR